MILLFNGPPGSGKDQACLTLQSLGWTHLSFKEELFKETFKFFDVSEQWFMKGYENRSIKEKPVPELILEGREISRRDAMIYVSEKYIKPKFGKDYFGSNLAKKIVPGTDTCISDGGFEDELSPIINKFGTDDVVIVQLTRDGCDFSSDSRRYFSGNLVQEFVVNKKTPISSFHILPSKFDIRTYRVHNNGTKDEFRTILLTIHEKELNVRNKKAKGKTDTSLY